MKQRAIRKVQIAIDKMIDLNEIMPDTQQVLRILDSLRDLECSIDSGKVKDGKIYVHSN